MGWQKGGKHQQFAEGTWGEGASAAAAGWAAEGRAAVVAAGCSAHILGMTVQMEGLPPGGIPRQHGVMTTAPSSLLSQQVEVD